MEQLDSYSMDTLVSYLLDRYGLELILETFYNVSKENSREETFFKIAMSIEPHIKETP